MDCLGRGEQMKVLIVLLALIFSLEARTQSLTNVSFTSLMKEADLRPIHQATSPLNFAGSKRSVLFFWASWCPNCKGFMNDFLLTAAKVSGCKFQFVMISEDDVQSEALGFLKEWKIAVPNYLDTKGKLRTKLQLKKIPAMVIVDSEGVIQQSFVGNRAFEKGLSSLHQVSRGGHCEKK